MKRKFRRPLCAAILLLGLVLRPRPPVRLGCKRNLPGTQRQPHAPQRQHHAHPGGRDHLCPLHHLCGQSERRIKLGVFDGDRTRPKHAHALQQRRKNLTLTCGLGYPMILSERRAEDAHCHYPQRADLCLSQPLPAPISGWSVPKATFVFGTKYYPISVSTTQMPASATSSSGISDHPVPHPAPKLLPHRHGPDRRGRPGGESTPPSASLPTPAPDSRRAGGRVHLALRCDTGGRRERRCWTRWPGRAGRRCSCSRQTGWLSGTT